MKKSIIRYSLIIAALVYACFVIASIFIAYKTYKYPPMYGTGFHVFFTKIWDGSLFLFNMLLFLGSTVKTSSHLFGQARIGWAFLWAFLLHGLIGMWFIIPVSCYAYLCYYKRAWKLNTEKNTIYELWSIWYFSVFVDFVHIMW